MAKKTDVFNVSTTDTVIGSGVKLKGNVSSEGDIAIDGVLAGNIKSGGHVTIGLNGRIGGSIQATSATIAGYVEGHITASDSVSVMESGQVHGDIDTGRLEIALGATFIGTSKMKPLIAAEVAERTEVNG
jgi:cytoskeletal protein CcmA (bactofilin family)